MKINKPGPFERVRMRLWMKLCINKYTELINGSTMEELVYTPSDWSITFFFIPESITA